MGGTPFVTAELQKVDQILAANLGWTAAHAAVGRGGRRALQVAYHRYKETGEGPKREAFRAQRAELERMILAGAELTDVMRHFKIEEPAARERIRLIGYSVLQMRDIRRTLGLEAPRKQPAPPKRQARDDQDRLNRLRRRAEDQARATAQPLEIVRPKGWKPKYFVA